MNGATQDGRVTAQGRAMPLPQGRQPTQLPSSIQGEDAQRAARIIRHAARELHELRFPLLAAAHLGRMIVEGGGTPQVLDRFLRQLERLRNYAFTPQERTLLEQLSTLDFEGPQAVLRTEGG